MGLLFPLLIKQILSTQQQLWTLYSLKCVWTESKIQEAETWNGVFLPQLHSFIPQQQLCQATQPWGCCPPTPRKGERLAAGPSGFRTWTAQALSGFQMAQIAEVPITPTQPSPMSQGEGALLNGNSHPPLLTANSRGSPGCCVLPPAPPWLWAHPPLYLSPVQTLGAP